MFGSTGLYMFTFVGKALWYAGFGTNAYWNQANPNFPGAWPIRDMTDYVNDVVAVDGNGVLWYIGLPGAGEWVQGYFPQPPFPFKQFMGSGDNGIPVILLIT